MQLSLRSWKPGQMLASWGVYWAGLIGVGLGPAIAAGFGATRLPEGHGSIEASVSNGTLSYAVIEDGVKTFTTTLQLSTAMLWVVGPPLLLWLVWLLVRRRRTEPEPAMPESRRRPEELGAGTWRADERVVGSDRAHAKQERTPTPNP
jgi:hypothetical protein